jgi:hypothetical protein
MQRGPAENEIISTGDELIKFSLWEIYHIQCDII